MGDMKELKDVVKGTIMETSDRHARQFLLVETIAYEGEDSVIVKRKYQIVPQLRIEKDRIKAVMVVEEVKL